MRIDAHNHPNWYGYTFDRFIQNMDENGIDKTCIISWETPESEHIIGQTWIVSDYMTTGGPPVPAPFSQCVHFTELLLGSILVGNRVAGVDL